MKPLGNRRGAASSHAPTAEAADNTVPDEAIIAAEPKLRYSPTGQAAITDKKAVPPADIALKTVETDIDDPTLTEILPGQSTVHMNHM